jgi:hypothetical protein
MLKTFQLASVQWTSLRSGSGGRTISFSNAVVNAAACGLLPYLSAGKADREMRVSLSMALDFAEPSFFVASSHSAHQGFMPEM